MTFDPTFNFTTKQQYLVWRLRWKEEYFRLITVVRQSKIGVKDAMRAYAKDGRQIGDLWGAITARRRASKAVTDHLHLLWRAKEEAGRQTRERLAHTG